MAGLNHQACGVLDLASAARCPDRALLSKHSNQNEKPDLGQESDAHDRDRKEHVARRERVHECLAPSEAPGVNHSGEGGLRPPAVQPVLTAFIGFPDNHLLEMLALRTSERQKVGMGGTRFDPGQHHPAGPVNTTVEMEKPQNVAFCGSPGLKSIAYECTPPRCSQTCTSELRVCGPVQGDFSPL